jgi:phenylpropionate dioxygenase-like ring-hydroxylating dioxygenase large terminal subunit
MQPNRSTPAEAGADSLRRGPASLPGRAGMLGTADLRELIPPLGFPEYWYPLVGLTKISSRKPRRVSLLGKDLCVFMGRTGPVAVEDLCPHRGTALSGGRCHFQGTVSCPYHGWTFDERGDCVAVLSDAPNARRHPQARVRVYPTVILKKIVFVWMGDGQPTDPHADLPPELFDETCLVLHDATLWNANWRPSLENLKDNHAPYLHRNSLSMLMRPIGKKSYRRSTSVYLDGAVTLSTYNDGERGGAPYREYYPGVKGYWPKHRYRLLWTWAFRRRPLIWLQVERGRGGITGRRSIHFEAPEWNGGVRMPGMYRINRGLSFYTRWCVPVSERQTRQFYLHCTRPASRWEKWLERIRYPLAYRLLYYRNLGRQDGSNLAHTSYDSKEHLTALDRETIAWRRLAAAASQCGGRHDAIPGRSDESAPNEPDLMVRSSRHEVSGPLRADDPIG